MPLEAIDTKKSSLIDDISFASKKVADDPSGMRNVIKGVVSVISGLGIFFILGPGAASVVTTLKMGDSVIKVFQVGKQPNKWINYRYEGPLLLVKDITSTFITLVGIPTFLDKVGVISLANFSLTLGKIPVVGSFIVAIPFTPILNILEIFVATYNLGTDIDSTIKYASGQKDEHIQEKLAKWKKMSPEEVKTDVSKDFDTKYGQKQTQEVVDASLVMYKAKKIEKWEFKSHDTSKRLTSNAFSIAFNLSLIALMTLLCLTPFGLAFTGVTTLIIIAGISLSVFGSLSFFYDIFNPEAQGVKYQLPRQAPTLLV